MHACTYLLYGVPNHGVLLPHCTVVHSTTHYFACPFMLYTTHPLGCRHAPYRPHTGTLAHPMQSLTCSLAHTLVHSSQWGVGVGGGGVMAHDGMWLAHDGEDQSVMANGWHMIMSGWHVAVSGWHMMVSG